jgi:hypothetical protein
MKPLYYLEFAQSVDNNDNLIPATSFKWFTPNHIMIAYEDRDLCDHERFAHQGKLTKYVVRVKKASWFKNLKIRLNNGSDWAVCTE